MNQIIENYFKRNTLLEAPEWNTITWVSLLWKIKGLVNWEVNALLTKDEVLNWYYYSEKKWWVIKESEPWKMIFDDARFLTDEFISDHIYNKINNKDAIIKRNLDKFYQEILEIWNVTNKDLFITYINAWYLDHESIKLITIEYLSKKWKKILNKAKEPLMWSSRLWQKFRIKNYHDLDHDLSEIEKQILAYMIVNGSFNDNEINEIINLLQKWWDDLDYFLQENYVESFVNYYIIKYNYI